MDQLNESQKDESISKEFSEGYSRYGSNRVLITAIAAVILLSIIWINNSVKITHLKEDAVRDSQMMRGEATKQVVQSHEEHLRLLAKPFVWAIRAELRQNNLRQIKLYMNEMVEKTNFKHIAVADKKGQIIASTDRKDEGKHFSTIGKKSFLYRTTTTLENLNNKTLIMSTPIMDSGGRMGTLIITYNILPLKFR